MTSLQDYFSRLDLMSDLSPEAACEFPLLWRIGEYPAEAAVALAGDEKRNVFLILEGTLELYRLAQGKKIVLDTLTAGSIFGDLTFAHPPFAAVSDNRVRALTQALVGSTAGDKFRTFLERNPVLALPLLVQLRNQLHRYESKMKDLALSPADVRVINELIRYAIRAGADTGTFLELKEKLTHETLGAMVGVTRETVTKATQTLRDAGFLAYTPDHRIRLNKKKILEECLDCLKPK